MGRTFYILGILWIVVKVDCFSTGAPMTGEFGLLTCNVMVPFHNVSESTSDLNMYPSSRKSSYSPGDLIWFTLYTVGTKFKGYAIQLRRQSDGAPVGTMFNYYGNSLVDCGGTNTTITHSDPSYKTFVTFRWKAPLDPQGDLDIVATIVTDINTWHRRVIWSITDETPTTQTTTTSTTTTTTTTPAPVITQPTTTPPQVRSTGPTVDGTSCPVEENLKESYDYIAPDENGWLRSKCYTDDNLMLSTHKISPNVSIVNCRMYALAFDTHRYTDINQQNTFLNISQVGYAPGPTSNGFCQSFVAIRNVDKVMNWECEQPTTADSYFRGYFLADIVNFGPSWPKYCFQIRKDPWHQCTFVWCNKFV